MLCSAWVDDDVRRRAAEAGIRVVLSKDQFEAIPQTLVDLAGREIAHSRPPGALRGGASRACSARVTCSNVTTPRSRPSASTAISAPRRRSGSEPSSASSGASAATWSPPRGDLAHRRVAAPSRSAACSTAARWATPA